MSRRSTSRVKLKFDKRRLIRVLAERIRDEKREYDEAKKQYKADLPAAQKQHMEEMAQMLEKAASDVRKCRSFKAFEKLPITNHWQGIKLEGAYKDVTDVDDLCSDPPHSPICRKAQMAMLKAAKGDVIELNQDQFVQLVGSDPCEFDNE